MTHRGTPLEWQVAHKFEKLGYRVKRSYASLGIYDILAFKKYYVRCDCIGYTSTEVLEIQVKGTPYEFKDEDKAALKQHAEAIGARAVYAYRRRKKGQKRGKIFIEYL